ncbi:hypothetical protein SNOG_08386 [Parastagonospora nodorum SN15]|uniref:Uncharacterized protein n=1 Tax=Phaeosphaeria nodorum (strain SN15 / ATCC MYA-4574 / FGSC 10173) TaxID=321614 RepID=Q0UIM8_PHANO|nr:hypothetical protein SNOG_08386 [Parastagonospora nodorum SN15]EAT84662.1 hypothetical protein SNOG_08386 [Parastagonospora nodorum SN15]
MLAHQPTSGKTESGSAVDLPTRDFDCRFSELRASDHLPPLKDKSDALDHY